MNTLARAPLAAASPRWWWLSPALLFVAFAIVLIGFVGLHARGNWLRGPVSIVVPAAGFNIMRGTGHASGKTFVLDALDDTGSALVGTHAVPFTADKYPRVELNVAAPGPVRPALAVLWRTREHPGRTFVKQFEWQDNRVAPLELTVADGWTGTVSGVVLAVRGELSAPLAFDSLVMPGISAATVAADIGREWAARHPFQGNSIVIPFDTERDQRLSLVAATALAVGLAIAGYAALARRRRWPLDARVCWAIFLAGWLLLDARWQVNLWRQLAATGAQFAGKTGEEKHLAADDRELYSIMREMAAALPAAPVRIMFLADNGALRARGAYFLYPHNVDAFYAIGGRKAPTLDPDTLRAGDHVLVFLYGGATYDRAAGALAWPDGRRRAVDEILFKTDGVALLRLK
jgi:hypothetical protein